MKNIIITNEMYTEFIKNAFKTEGYEVSDADLQSKALEYARQYGYQTATAYINAVGEEYIRNQIVLDYAMDLILEKAVIK